MRRCRETERQRAASRTHRERIHFNFSGDFRAPSNRFFFFFFFFFVVVVVVSSSTPEERSTRLSQHTQKRERKPKRERERNKKKRDSMMRIPGTTRARRTICTRSNPSRPVPWRKAPRSTPTLRLSPPGTRPGGRRCTRRINYYSLLLLYILLLRYYYKRRRPMGSSLSRVQKRGCEEKAMMRPRSKSLSFFHSECLGFFGMFRVFGIFRV